MKPVSLKPLLLSALIALAGCATTSGGSGNSGAGTMNDLITNTHLPAGAKINHGQSLIMGSGDNWVGRVVLELDRVRSIDDTLIDALAAVGSSVRDDGGLVRVCGLSDGDLRRLRSSERGCDLPHFESRSAAVGPRSTAVP